MTDPATILLVEDDKALLDGIADLLEISDIGYEVKVLTASDGVGGLNTLREQLPDLIVSDIMMPRMGGYEFLNHIRRNPNWLHIPVIFLTAKGTPKDIREGRLSGAELYVTKPYDSDELLELIQSQLDRAFQLQIDRQRRLTLLRRNIVQVLNHEFRTPLTYVTAYYDLLAEGLFSEDVTILWEYLRGIQTGAIRLKRLVDDLITVIELRTGEMAARFNRQAVPINDLGISLRSMCERYRHEHDSQRLSFMYQIEEAIPVVYGQRENLLDACERLIDNAVKFSEHQPGGAEVRVSVSSAEDKIRVKVEDNGIGIPNREYKQIFDLFYQHNRPVLEQQGAGTGLTIARGLVELHGGYIEVASKERIGSSFTIVLPAMVQTTDKDRIEEPGSPSPRLASVLLVEDEVNLLEGMRDLLELFDGDYQLSVLAASNSVDALAILKRRRVDLIISDIKMPGMDGYGFLAEVRRNPALIHIPFIFLTAKSERRDVMQGLGSGVEEYITKPYNENELFGLVCVQLDRHFVRQDSMQSDFEELKRGILDVLLPGLRIPLEAVSEYSERLSGTLNSALTEQDLLSQLSGIHAGSNQLTRLAEDFIFLAELQTGEARKSFKLRSEPTNAASILDEVSREYNRRNEPNVLQFERNLSLDLPLVTIDREMFWNCLERLIEVVATIKNTAGDGAFIGDDQAGNRTIILTATSEGADVYLSVATRDAQLSREQSNRMSALLAGSELVVLELSEYSPGLMIIKGGVDLHSGWMFIDNQRDSGFSFKIVLPSIMSD